MVAGDSAATLQALADNTGLFRLGILGDTVVLLAEVIITVMLYIMFKPISPTLSMICAFARLSMIMVMAVNLLINIMPLILIDSISPEQTMTLFKAHQYGVYIWGILFGLHLLVLGYLIVKSGFFPRVLGWMMLLGSFGYLIEGITKITATEGTYLGWMIIGLLILVTIGELSFALWLLVRGVNLTAWERVNARGAVTAA